MSDTPVTPHHPPRAAERIRDTARDLFYRRGIRAVGVEEIVQEAGVTKPSLYRSYASKDELAALCLQEYRETFFARFDAALAAYPGDPRAAALAFFAAVAARTAEAGYRGCGLTNAGLEYPEAEHPAHQLAAAHKRHLRARFRDLADEMGAKDAAGLGDGLLLLLEGAYVTGQLLPGDGPGRAVAAAAEALISAYTAR